MKRWRIRLVGTLTLARRWSLRKVVFHTERNKKVGKMKTNHVAVIKTWFINVFLLVHSCVTPKLKNENFSSKLFNMRILHEASSKIHLCVFFLFVPQVWLSINVFCEFDAFQQLKPDLSRTHQQIVHSCLCLQLNNNEMVMLFDREHYML